MKHLNPNLNLKNPRLERKAFPKANHLCNPKKTLNVVLKDGE
jgi:hypothetical protein